MKYCENRVSRRRFIRAAAVAASPMIVPGSALARGLKAAPSERITLGVVGLGSRGFNLIDAFLNEADAQIVAICDVDGWVFVDRGRLEASDPRWTKVDFDRGPIRVYQSPGHARNFLDCVKSRKPCVAPAETAHRSITPGHLGYVANAVGRALSWDARAERIVGDDEAENLLKAVSYRKPWR